MLFTFDASNKIESQFQGIPPLYTFLLSPSTFPNTKTPPNSQYE